MISCRRYVSCEILLRCYGIISSSIRRNIVCQVNQENINNRTTIGTQQSGIDTIKVSKGAKIRNRQVPHLTQDTNGKVTNSQPDTTNESQEVSPFPAGDHKAHTNRRAQRHSKHKTEQKHKRSTK